MTLFLLAIACTTVDSSKDNATELDGPQDTGTAPGGDHGMGAPDYNPCDEISTTTLAADDASATGFSGLDILSQTAAITSSTASWTEGNAPDTAIHIVVSSAGEPIFHDLEASMDTGSPSQGSVSGCVDFLEQPVSIEFYTDDGAFSETVTSSINATDLDSISVGAEFDPNSLNGNFAFVDFDPTEWDTVGLRISNSWANGGFLGQINVEASREPDGDSGTLSATGMTGPVLRWP